MTDKPRLLVLRADADGKTGAGHIMRCLALAQEWQNRGGEAIFLGHISTGLLQERIKSEGFTHVAIATPHPDAGDLSMVIPWLRDNRDRAGWVTLDGYHFDPTYHQALRRSGWPLMIIDDYAHLPAYHADILVNPNAQSETIDYPVEEHTLLLRGTRFAPLRKEFQQAIATRNNEPDSRYRRPGQHILVTMGGADPDNVTEKIVAALISMKKRELTVKIIVGPLNPHRQAIAARLRHAMIDAEILPPVSEMAPLMCWADLAISASGSTCWELAALGVPMAVTVLADNQERLAASLADQGAAVNLGWHHHWRPEPTAKVLLALLDDRQKRQAMADKGQRLVDGQGCQRLTRAMQGCGFSLRPAAKEDCKTLFDWANDPATRAVSFSQEPIAWQEHCRWFASRLADHDHLFYIAITSEGLPMAQARFTLLEGKDTAVMSVSLAPEFRGSSLGPILIRRACDQASADIGVKKIYAHIKPSNIASLHAFTQAGFHYRAMIQVLDQPAVAMDYRREDRGRSPAPWSHPQFPRWSLSPGPRVIAPMTTALKTPSLTIANRLIGPGHRVYIIAEMSANHGQDFDQAIKILEAARDAGADAVKLQTYTADTLTIACDKEPFRIKGTAWQGKNLHELYQEAFTPWEWQPRLAAAAAAMGLDCFSTPFDDSAVDFLETIGVPAHKVASFELVDLALLRKVAATGKPVIMSTGMATLAEIDEAVTTLRQGGCREIALLKCTSAYPAPAAAMNLRTIPHLAQAFGVVTGLSDHTLGLSVPVTAVAMGAAIIEKHLTLSRNVPGPDCGFSLEPGEFKAMVTAVREAEQALGAVSYAVTEQEESSRAFRRSLFVVREIKAGEVFTPDNLRSIRPGHGLHPRYINLTLGRRATQDIERGTPLAWEHIGGALP